MEKNEQPKEVAPLPDNHFVNKKINSIFIRTFVVTLISFLLCLLLVFINSDPIKFEIFPAMVLSAIFSFIIGAFTFLALIIYMKIRYKLPDGDFHYESEDDDEYNSEIISSPLYLLRQRD